MRILIFIIAIICIEGYLLYTSHENEAVQVSYAKIEHKKQGEQVKKNLPGHLLDAIMDTEELEERFEEELYIAGIDLSGQQLEAFPMEIFRYKNLTYLNLSNTGLKVLPEGLSQLKRLRVIDFSNNDLTHLPEDIGRLRELIELDVSNNTLMDLPRSLNESPNLVRLNVSENQLGYSVRDGLLSKTIHFPKLEYLDVSNNNLDKIQFNPLTSHRLVFVNLSQNKFQTFPTTLAAAPYLERIDLKKNKLRELSDVVSTMQNLKYLDLSYNQFETIPTVLSDLKRLVGLDIANNEITLSNMPKLHVQRLNLAYNDIDIVPSDIQKQKQLEMLKLTKNNIHTISNKIGALKRLKTVFLSHNQLDSLPNGLIELQRLEILTLKENPISSDYQKEIEAEMNSVKIKF